MPVPKRSSPRKPTFLIDIGTADGRLPLRIFERTRGRKGKVVGFEKEPVGMLRRRNLLLKGSTDAVAELRDKRKYPNESVKYVNTDVVLSTGHFTPGLLRELFASVHRVLVKGGCFYITDTPGVLENLTPLLREAGFEVSGPFDISRKTAQRSISAESAYDLMHPKHGGRPWFDFTLKRLVAKKPK